MSSATGILGRKIGMTQVFSRQGTANAFLVTVIEAGPCRVLQVKTEKSDGYNAIPSSASATRKKRTRRRNLVVPATAIKPAPARSASSAKYSLLNAEVRRQSRAKM